MIEKMLESPLGYIKGCYSKGVRLDDWKIVSKDGLIWIENQNIGVRIRNEFPTITAPTGRLSDCRKELNVEQLVPEATSNKQVIGIPSISVMDSKTDYGTDYFSNHVRELREAGLLGPNSDRTR